MKEIEELLRRDRAAGLPEPPAVRYTVAVVRRRLGQSPDASMRRLLGQSPGASVACGLGQSPGASVAPPAPHGAPPPDKARTAHHEDWLLLLIAAGTLAAAAAAAISNGLDPRWLLAVPLLILPLSPILVRKGV